MKGILDRMLSLFGNKNARERVFLARARRYYAEALNQSGTVTRSESDTDTDYEYAEQHSYLGNAADGKKIYESNFPKGTPKLAKSQRILEYIQKVWSKKPIKLVISNGETSRTIFAKFDPTIDETQNTPTDASKLAGGNRHGNHTEQRVTLDLADDYYQIASDSIYNYSKIETGKDLITHDDVIMWHYFVNDIYFAEYGEKELTPYTVTINVKEKSDGEFVYSFNAEKESSTRRTLHADVNTYKGANGELFLNDSILNPNEKVNKNSKNDFENSSHSYSNATPVTSSTPIIDSTPKVVQNNISRTEAARRNDIGNIFAIPANHRKMQISEPMRAISGEYMREGTVSEETIQNVFDSLYDVGIQEREAYIYTKRKIHHEVLPTALCLRCQMMHLSLMIVPNKTKNVNNNCGSVKKFRLAV